MSRRDDLSVADVLGMDTVLMQRYGGALGLRDLGAFEAALYRPRTGYYEDIVAEAAALLESLAGNHPFLDGNKRIAFAAADVFLRINGWRLQRSPMRIHIEMIEMFEPGTFDIAHLEPWLRSFASPAD
jgi:death-on-curing protein